MMDRPNETSGATAPRRRSRRLGRRPAGESRLSWSWGLLCTATIGSGLLLGGLHTPTVVVAALLVFASAVLVVNARSVRLLPAPAQLLFAMAGYTALQAVPLPSSWVHALSPAAGDVWQSAFDLTSDGWMSLSLDRGATLIEALKWSMYGAAFVSAAAFGAARTMARGLLLPLGSALLMASATLAHGLAGATSVFGVYTPTFGPSIWHIGPLLNPNHLASYLNLGLFCGLGLLVARRRFWPRWATGLAVAFLIPNAIVAGSRGGVLGLGVGVVTFFLLLPKRGRADAEFGPVPRLALVASIATVAALAAGFTSLLASDGTSRELFQSNVDKIRLLFWSGLLIEDYPWFGVGRGAFESVFPAYRSGTNNEIFTHPENLPAQWVAEWGVVVGAASLVAFIWLLRPRRLGASWSAVACGAAAGSAAVFVQNLADFGLELPAVSLVVVVALGVCWGHHDARKTHAERADAATTSLTRGVLGGVAVGWSLLVYGLSSRPLAFERLALSEAYTALDRSSSVATERLRQFVASAVLSHPAEPYFYRLGALLAWRAGQDPMPWLQRALARGPSIGRTHLLVARVLASRRAVSQALLELRLAVTFDPALAPHTASAAVSWTQDYVGLLRAVPPGRDGSVLLAALARQLPDTSTTRERLLVESVARDPARREPARTLAEDLLRELERGRGSIRCAQEQVASCLVAAERWVATVERLSGPDAVGLLLRTRLLRLKGAEAHALALLSERCPVLIGRPRTQCIRARLDLAAGSADAQTFASAAKDFVADHCIDSDDCASALEKVANISGTRGDWHAALAFYDRAARERPEDRLWIKVARAGAQVGALTRVLIALERIRSKSQFEPEYSRLWKIASAGRIDRVHLESTPPVP